MKKKRFQHIIPPEGGWKEHTVYLVEMCFGSGNPIFRGIMHVSFITERSSSEPEYAGIGNYIVFPGMEELKYLYEVYYLKVVRELTTKEEMREFPDHFKLHYEVYPEMHPEIDPAFLEDKDD